MKRTLLGIVFVLGVGTGAALGAQSFTDYGLLTHREVTAASPCGGWWPWYSETVTPFVKNDDLYLLTRCSDGRLFVSQFAIATPGPVVHNR